MSSRSLGNPFLHMPVSAHFWNASCVLLGLVSARFPASAKQTSSLLYSPVKRAT